ncbi:hypothetical protein SH449x_002866 [Pirellulaceae bacterium SH449]
MKLRIDLLEAKIQLLEQTINTSVAERDADNKPSGSSSNSSLAPPAENNVDPFRVVVVWVGDAKYADRTAKLAFSISARASTSVIAFMGKTRSPASCWLTRFKITPFVVDMLARLHLPLWNKVVLRHPPERVSRRDSQD